MRHRPLLRVAMLVSLAALAVYLASFRAPLTTDSVTNVLLAYSLAGDRDIHLDEFEATSDRLSFLRFRSDGHSVPVFPPGTALYAAPFAAIGLALGIAPPDVASVMVIGKLAAAIAAAVSVLFVYLLAARIAGRRGAAVVALLYAFGTSTWPVSAGALWQHGPAQALLAITQYVLWPRRGPTAHGPRAGLAAGLAALVRVQDAAFALAAIAFITLRRWRWLVPFIAWTLPGAIVLIAFNVAAYGSPISGQYSYYYRAGDVLVGMAGNLVSPSRGILVASPFLVLALFALLQRARRADDVGILIRAQLLAVVAILAVHGSYLDWWGGLSYGNRYMADALPFLTIGLALWIRRHHASRRARRTLGALAVPAVAIAATGALLYDLTRWSWERSSADHAALMWQLDPPQWWYAMTHAAARPDGPAAASIALVLVVWAALALVVLRADRSRSSRLRPRRDVAAVAP